jgi:hypothetical protein
MKIYSKFKDYYDSCVGYGVDPKLVYMRKTRKEDVKTNRPYGGTPYQGLLKPLVELFRSMPTLGGWKIQKANCGVVGFCGEAYPFYRYEGKAYYQFSKLVAAVQDSKDGPIKEEYLDCLFNKRSRYGYRFNRHYGSLNLKTWTQWYEEADLTISNELHRHFDSPIIVITDGQIEVNPRLNKLNFATQVDPFQAFQRLSMYISNDLSKQMDPEVHVSDVIKAESRGFDQWSFRTHPKESKKPRGKKK